MLADLQEDYIFALKHLPTHMVEGPRGSQWFLAEKREKKNFKSFLFPVDHVVLEFWWENGKEIIIDC